jgi:hypothetical protein
MTTWNPYDLEPQPGTRPRAKEPALDRRIGWHRAEGLIVLSWAVHKETTFGIQPTKAVAPWCLEMVIGLGAVIGETDV